jgi:hypothetical protein
MEELPPKTAKMQHTNTTKTAKNFFDITENPPYKNLLCAMYYIKKNYKIGKSLQNRETIPPKTMGPCAPRGLNLEYRVE